MIQSILSLEKNGKITRTEKLNIVYDEYTDEEREKVVEDLAQFLAKVLYEAVSGNVVDRALEILKEKK